ncbi:hypothetical protein, partial [Escherichia coli]|uniref:hypothetical protein n=1 Tax=Escherichia coli TaxID=562 RepID=UPI003FD699FE
RSDRKGHPVLGHQEPAWLSSSHCCLSPNHRRYYQYGLYRLECLNHSPYVLDPVHHFDQD